jgi:DNA-binding transcriptional regulator YbjK
MSTWSTPDEIQKARDSQLAAFQSIIDRRDITPAEVLMAIYSALMDTSAQLAELNQKLERITEFQEIVRMWARAKGFMR